MFFEQKFIIYHSSGYVEFVDNLLVRIGYRIDDFYAAMLFSLTVQKPIDRFSYMSMYRSGYRSPGSAEHDFGFFLYNENGLMISPDLLYAEYTKISDERTAERIKRWGSRNTGHNSTPHTTTYDRRFKTIAARRAACAVQKDEGEPEFRGARRSLPDPWDEFMTRKSCSWKNCTKRKRQYKGS